MAKVSKRQLQVGEVVKRNFSIVLYEQGKYIYGNEPLVSVTNVLMSSDLGLAKIYLSIYNFVNKQEVIVLLEKEKVRLRQALGGRIRKHVRRIPHIDFYIDDTLDEMYALNNLFDKLHDDKQMGEEKEDNTNDLH